MKRLAKGMSVFLSGMLALSLVLSACGGDGAKKDGNAATTAAAASDGQVKEALPKPADYDVAKELKAYEDVMQVRVYADAWGSTVTKDDWTVKWLMDNFKIDVSELTVHMNGNFADRVKAMAATNDLPDVVWGADLGLFQSLSNGGFLLPLDDLVKNYMPRVQEFVTPEIQDKYKSNDGKMYIMPCMAISPEELNKYWFPGVGPVVNMDYLAAANMQVPKTPDELYAFLKAASELKTTAGKKVIPMAYVEFLPERYKNSNYPYEERILQHMFEAGTGFHYMEKDDSAKMIHLAYDRKSYVAFLKFFAKLNREGLMDKDNFTMTYDQFKERLKENRYAFTWGSPSDCTLANNALTKTVIKPYTPVPMVKDASITGSTKSQSANVLGQWWTVINKNVKDPERLAKFMEWQYTMDGVRIINYGAPDKEKQVNNWYYDDQGNVVIDMELGTKWDSEKYGWQWEKAGGWGMHEIGLRAPLKYTGVNEMGVDMSDDFYKALDANLSDEATCDPAMEAVLLQQKGPWFEKYGPALNDLLNKWEVKIIASAKSDEEVDSLYEKMMNEARQAGYDDMKKEMYELYLKANRQ